MAHILAPWPALWALAALMQPGKYAPNAGFTNPSAMPLRLDSLGQTSGRRGRLKGTSCSRTTLRLSGRPSLRKPMDSSRRRGLQCPAGSVLHEQGPQLLLACWPSTSLRAKVPQQSFHVWMAAFRAIRFGAQFIRALLEICKRTLFEAGEENHFSVHSTILYCPS